MTHFALQNIHFWNGRYWRKADIQALAGSVSLPAATIRTAPSGAGRCRAMARIGSRIWTDMKLGAVELALSLKESGPESGVALRS